MRANWSDNPVKEEQEKPKRPRARRDTTDPLGHSVNVTYDAAGNVAAVADARGNVTSYQYNGQNKVIQVTAADGGITRFTYDGNKKLPDQVGHTDGHPQGHRRAP